MNTKDAAVLKAACESLRDRYVTPQGSVLYRLETVEKNLLAQKILLLPELERSLVFSKYYFNLSPAAAGEILDIPNPRERMACCAELLAISLGLYGGIIDDPSMKAATDRAMRGYIYSNRSTDIPTHEYSKNFRNQLSEINTVPHRGGLVLLFAKRIAIAAVIAAMTITTALATSPALRRAVFEWVVNTFPKYSQIGASDVSKDPTEADFEILKQYYPTYIPEGYGLYERFREFSPVIYNYHNSVEGSLSFLGDVPSESLMGYNTEGAIIETLTYLGQPAFYWVQDGFTYFIWQQDGFQFSIVGEITKEDAIKMAESTKLQN